MNRKEIFLPKTIGQRYVFYESLKDENIQSGNITAQEVYSNAKSFFNQGNKYFNIEDKDSVYNKSLNILLAVINNEKSKEVAFIKNLSSRKDIPESLRVKISNYTASGNYMELIRIINEYYLGSLSFESQVKQERERLTKIGEIISNNAVNITDRENLYTELLGGKKDGISIDGILDKKDRNSLLNLMHTMQDFSFSQMNSNKKVLDKITSKIIPVLEEHKIKLIDGYQLNKIVRLLDFLVLKILQEELSQEISQSRYKNILSYTSKTNFNKVINNNNGKKTFEEIIDETIEKIIPVFDKLELLEDLGNNIFADEPKILQAKYNEINKDISILEGHASKNKKISKKNENKTLEQLYDEQKQINKDLEDLPNKNLKIKNGGSMWFDFEILSVLLPWVENAVYSELGTGSNKDDTVTYYLHYSLPETDDLNFKEMNSKVEHLNSLVYKYKQEMKEISENSKMNSTDFKMRAKRILERTEELKKEYDKMNDSYSGLKEIKDAFIVHGTNKRYSIFDSTEGFAAGVLGTAKKGWGRGFADATSAIENITLMAQLGGISDIDSNWLINAAINTASGLIAQDMKDPLEKLLSSLAGALMFDDAALILDEINQQAVTEAAQVSISQIHLYNLQGFYFPLSYVLQETYNGLIKVQGAIESNYKGNKITIKNNYQTKNFENEKISASTWEREGQKALSDTGIKMTFMAGFLDILNNLFPV